MLKFLLLIFINLFAASIRSQNIYSALHLNEEREYKAGRPKTRTEISIFYTKDGKTTEKSVEVFDEAGMVLTEDRYDNDGTLTARLSFTNDTVRRLVLISTFERWTSVSHTKETAFYSYDSSDYLIRVIHKDGNGNISERTEVTNNEKGYPIQLSEYDANGGLYGIETARYSYNINKAVIFVQNDGRILSTDTIKINFNNAHLYPEANETYNDKGDVTSWVSKSINGTVTPYEAQYQYDIAGNCIEETIYKVTVTAKAKRKRELDRVFRRAYTY